MSKLKPETLVRKISELPKNQRISAVADILADYLEDLPVGLWAAGRGGAFQIDNVSFDLTEHGEILLGEFCEDEDEVCADCGERGVAAFASAVAEQHDAFHEAGDRYTEALNSHDFAAAKLMAVGGILIEACGFASDIGIPERAVEVMLLRGRNFATSQYAANVASAELDTVVENFQKHSKKNSVHNK